MRFPVSSQRCVQTAQYSRSTTTIVIVVMYVVFFIHNVSSEYDVSYISFVFYHMALVSREMKNPQIQRFLEAWASRPFYIEASI